MLILAIDTSAVASAALVSDDAPESVVASFATEDTRSHAEVLAPGIEELLAEAGVSGRDVDAIVTGRGSRTVHRAALRHRHRPHARLRLGQAAVRGHEPGRHRPGSRRIHRLGRGVPCGHRRAAQRGVLGPLHARRWPAAARWPTARTSASPRTCRTCPSTVPAPGSTPTSSRPSPNSAPRQPEALSLGQFALARLAAGEAAPGLHAPVPARIRRPGARTPEARPVSAGTRRAAHAARRRHAAGHGRRGHPRRPRAGTPAVPRGRLAAADVPRRAGAGRDPPLPGGRAARRRSWATPG